MRAAVLMEINKPLQILDLEQEPPKPKEVRVRVKAAGICMSDWHRPHCGRCRYCSSGQSVLCIGHNDTPRWRMHDGTARVRLNGEPVNQMTRIGTFSEEVVCPPSRSSKSATTCRSPMPR